MTGVAGPLLLLLCVVVSLVKVLASGDEGPAPGAASAVLGTTEMVALVDSDGPREATVMVAVGALLESGLVANVGVLEDGELPVAEAVVLVKMGVVVKAVVVVYDVEDTPDVQRELHMALMGMTMLDVCVVLEKKAEGAGEVLVLDPRLSREVVVMSKLAAELVVAVEVLADNFGEGGP